MALSKLHQQKLAYAKRKAEVYRSIGEDGKAQQEEAKVEALERQLEEQKGES